MKYDVVKNFNTKTQRLKAGMSIDAGADIEPFTFAERVENGFLAEKPEALKAAPAAEAAPAPTPAPRSAVSSQNAKADAAAKA